MDIYKQIIFSENKFNILLISLLPVSLLFGTFVSEIIIFLIIFFFFIQNGFT